MPVTLTPAGRRANEILDWAYEDPAGRTADAIRQVSELYRAQAGQPERNEVGDVATQLSRLESSTATMPSDTVSITGQLR